MELNKNKVGRPRKDIMKPQPVEYGERPKPEGGMAHSDKNKNDMWGGKLPPYPRHNLDKSKDKFRTGMALIK